MFTSSGSTGGRGGRGRDAKTISPNTSFGDIIRGAYELMKEIKVLHLGERRRRGQKTKYEVHIFNIHVVAGCYVRRSMLQN